MSDSMLVTSSTLHQFLADGGSLFRRKQTEETVLMLVSVSSYESLPIFHFAVRFIHIAPICYGLEMIS